MGKKLPYTPNSIIKSAIRRLFLISSEHSSVLKRDSYTCQKCHAKQSRAKGREVYVEVHHVARAIDWNAIYDVIRREVLVGPDEMETLCKKCHSEVDS